MSAALKTSKSTFIPRNTIIGKGIAYVRPFDKTLPLRPIEIELENNKCCLEIHNSSDCTVKFVFGNEILMHNQRALSKLIIPNTFQLINIYMTGLHHPL